MKKNYFSLLSVLFISPLFSQNDTLAVFKTEVITVNAPRSIQSLYKSAYAIEIIDHNSIQQGQKLVSLEEVLQSVPGVFVNNRHNFANGDRISIRGVGARSSFGVRGIKIILDDIPLTMADGQAQLNNLDLLSTGEINIIKGPSASLFGNASGGVIEIKSQGVIDSSYAQPQLMTGSFGLNILNVKAALKRGNNSYLINAKHLSLEGFREHSATNNYAFNLVAKNNLSADLKITTVLNYFYAPFSLNPSALDKETAKKSPASTRGFIISQGSGEKVEQGQAGVTLLLNGDGHTSRLTFFGLLRALKNPIPSDIIELSRKAGGMRFSWNNPGSIGTYDYVLTGGLDAEFQLDERKEYVNDGLSNTAIDRLKILEKIDYGAQQQHQDESVWSLGPFAKADLNVSDQLTLIFGGRYDYYKFTVRDKLSGPDNPDESGKRSFGHFSPMLGIVYQPFMHATFYGNYSTAFQTPTTSELSNLPDGAGGINPSLLPETIESYEIGVRGAIPAMRITYQSALYSMQFDNMLIAYQNAFNERVFYKNAGRSQNRGFELSLNWLPLEFFSILLTYDASDFIFTNYSVDSVSVKGNKVPGVAPAKFFAAVKYNNPASFFAEVSFNGVDSYFANDFNGPAPGENTAPAFFKNDSYLKMDFKIGAAINLLNTHSNVFVGINNMFDVRYNGSIVPNAFGNRFFEPSPGRNWYGAVNLML